MDRFTELQEKFRALGGYYKLSKEEQEEYKTLKVGTEPVTKEEDIKKNNDISPLDRIKKLEDQLASMAKENSSLREETSKLQEGWAEYVEPAKRNKTATLKIYRKDSESPAGVVIAISTFKNNAFDEETRKNDKLILNMKIKYEDGKEVDEKIDAKDFTKIREIEKVEIIKEDSRVLRKVEDYVRIPEKDKDGYPRRVLSGGSGYGQNVGTSSVPLEVFMVKSTVTVKRKNGQTIQMSSDFLNM